MTLRRLELLALFVVTASLAVLPLDANAERLRGGMSATDRKLAAQSRTAPTGTERGQQRFFSRPVHAESAVWMRRAGSARNRVLDLRTMKPAKQRAVVESYLRNPSLPVRVNLKGTNVKIRSGLVRGLWIQPLEAVAEKGLQIMATMDEIEYKPSSSRGPTLIGRSAAGVEYTMYAASNGLAVVSILETKSRGGKFTRDVGIITSPRGRDR